MKSIGIYYRVSTDKQDLKSQKSGVDDWLQNCEKKPDKIQIFEDEGISGKTERRPGLQAMLKVAYRGEIDTIVVYRLDRFSRNATTAIRLILDLDTAGVGFISVSQPVLNLGHANPFRRTMLAAFAEIAEIERETITARVRAGLVAAKKRGVRLGAPTKINAELIKEARLLRQNGHTFREISRRLSLSLGTIAKILNDHSHLKISHDP
ncbi:MAG: recombinase family protein [Proteobacteria bacterium]|nr:recombinase family protein [Pseudomonadota bacterium]